MKLLVVAPHSFCTDVGYRNCDLVALKAVNIIKESDTQHLVCDYHISDQLRVLGDYNRPTTNDTSWREDLRTKVARIKPDFVLEIHSFPGKHELYQRLWPDADLCLFESPMNTSYINQLIARIHASLGDIDHQFNIMKVVPWHPVSITDDMIAIKSSILPNLRHTSFEFNEDMEPEKVDILAKAVLEAVSSFGKQSDILALKAFNPRSHDISGGGLTIWLKKVWNAYWPLLVVMLLIILFWVYNFAALCSAK